jgi:hypothetical protein
VREMRAYLDRKNQAKLWQSVSGCPDARGILRRFARLFVR